MAERLLKHIEQDPLSWAIDRITNRLAFEQDYVAGVKTFRFDVPRRGESLLDQALGLLGGQIYRQPDLMTAGNVKIDPGVLIFNLPPVHSCPNSASCRSTCYAVPSYRQYPDVKYKYDANFALAKHNLPKLKKLLEDQLAALQPKIVRIHSSGDFFSQDYVDMWASVVKEFPQTNFYAYTKAEKALNLKPLEDLPNFNLIKSFIRGKFRNYGEPAYVKKVKAQVPEAYICPAIHNREVHCGAECNYCMKGKAPLFYIHGTMRKAGELPKPIEQKNI